MTKPTEPIAIPPVVEEEKILLADVRKRLLENPLGQEGASETATAEEILRLRDQLSSAKDEDLVDPLSTVDAIGWLGGNIRGLKLLCLAAGGGAVVVIAIILVCAAVPPCCVWFFSREEANYAI